jgi:hypothetical protein
MTITCPRTEPAPEPAADAGAGRGGAGVVGADVGGSDDVVVVIEDPVVELVPVAGRALCRAAVGRAVAADVDAQDARTVRAIGTHRPIRSTPAGLGIPAVSQTPDHRPCARASAHRVMYAKLRPSRIRPDRTTAVDVRLPPESRRATTMTNELSSILTLLVTGAAVSIAAVSWIHSRRAARLAAHYQLANAADLMIGSDKSLLRFHGIDPDSLEANYGVTATELAFLLQSFNAGAVEHLIGFGRRGKDTAFAEGSYRYNMLASEPTRRALPLLQQLFDHRNAFIARCVQTAREIEASGE